MAEIIKKTGVEVKSESLLTGLGTIEDFDDGSYEDIDGIIDGLTRSNITVTSLLEITDRLKNIGKVKNAIHIVNSIFPDAVKPTAVSAKLGEYCFLDGSPEQTVKLYNEALENSPQIADTYWFRKNLGEAYFYVGDKASALENLRVALKICNGSYEPTNSLCRYFYSENKTAELFDEINRQYVMQHSIEFKGPMGGENQQNLLVIDSCVPQADKDAGSVLMQGFLRTLATSGFDVWFYTDEINPDPKYILKLLSLGVRFLDRQYFESGNDMIASISNEIDAIMLTRVDSGGSYYEAVKRENLTKPIIFNTVDLHYLRTYRHYKESRNPATLLESKRLKRRESFLIRNCDATVIISDAEVKILNESTISGNLWQIPIIVDFPEKILPFNGRKNIAFIGSYAHLPNIDAVEYFCETVWPEISSTVGDTKLLIVGPNAPKKWSDDYNGKNNIEVVGFVDDLEELLGTISCTVVPLRIGAGQKGKIATSLAHGVPCISSATGIEGMRLVAGDNVIVCDDANEWLSAIDELTNDQAVWESLSNAGIEHAKAHYSEATVAGKLVNHINELIESSKISLKQVTT